jgi:hypothetical protein
MQNMQAKNAVKHATAFCSSALAGASAAMPDRNALWTNGSPPPTAPVLASTTAGVASMPAPHNNNNDNNNNNKHSYGQHKVLLGPDFMQ